jgi:D-glycero-D-manno-heptose 1,7-bisphosphate phosphatase
MKVIFLDRDGVINQYPGAGLYVTNAGQFHFINGSIEAIKILNNAGFKLFVISNQAGVSKGLYDEQDLEKINQKMRYNIEKQGGRLDGVYYCRHQDKDNCHCRKPKTGLLQQALSGQKAQQCYFIGDSMRDMITANNFGCKPVLVLSGQEKIADKKNWPFVPELIFKDLLAAAEYISGGG